MEHFVRCRGGSLVGAAVERRFFIFVQLLVRSKVRLQMTLFLL